MGRIGSTHGEPQKWSEAKQEWRKAASEPDWRPLAIYHGRTHGVPEYMGVTSPIPPSCRTGGTSIPPAPSMRTSCSLSTSTRTNIKQ